MNYGDVDFITNVVAVDLRNSKTKPFSSLWKRKTWYDK
jgi:hypothetical protein